MNFQKKEAYQRMKKLHDSFQSTFSRDLSIYVVQKQDPFDKTFLAVSCKANLPYLQFVNFQLTVGRCVSETRVAEESTDMASQCENLIHAVLKMPRIKELK